MSDENLIPISFPDEIYSRFRHEWQVNDKLRQITQISSKVVLKNKMPIVLSKTQWLEICVTISYLIMENPSQRDWGAAMRFIIQQAMDDLSWRHDKE